VKSVCVFLGSSPGASSLYAEAAAEMGRLTAEKGLTLVYGGAKVGLMKILADSALKAGGEVIGVIPSKLVEKEIAHNGLTDLRIVDSMHERKAMMAELSDAFIALPGGIGTLEEFFEVLTWTQLGFHQKPCGILNVNGYFDLLEQFLDNCVAQRFVTATHRDMIIASVQPEDLLAKLSAYQVEPSDKWLDTFADL
jgi:hypothetical protein